MASHAWDVASAQRASCQPALVGWPGMVLDTLAPRPAGVGADLADVVEQIIGLDRSGRGRGWSDPTAGMADSGQISATPDGKQAR